MSAPRLPSGERRAPLRTIVGTVEFPNAPHLHVEKLECGHEHVPAQEVVFGWKAAKRRRCEACLREGRT